MNMKSLLQLILMFVLQFEAGISGESKYLYNTPGEDVTLPCETVFRSDPTCSIATWLYDRDRTQFLTEAKKGKVRETSARAARLRVDSTCSLVINNITTEDVGFYICRPGSDNHLDAFIFLSVLTISPSPPDADPQRDGEVTLECSLLRHQDLHDKPCSTNSIRWLDETGTVLHGDGVGYSFLRQMNCVSVLTVKRQSGHNRKYTCQFVDEQNNVEIQADYIPDFTGRTTGDQTETSNPDLPLDLIFIIIGAVVGVVVVVVVVVVIAAVLIKHRKRAKRTKDVQKSSPNPDEPESNLTYVTVSHANQPASPYNKVKEEEVMYSTVNSVVRTEADIDPSGLYSIVSKPK